MSVSPSGQCTTVEVNDDGSAVVASCATIINQTGGVGISDGDKGDITVSGTGTVWTVDPQAITYSKIQDVTAQRLLGRTNTSSGSPQEISLGAGLKLSGTTLSTDLVVVDSTQVLAGTGLTGGGPLSGNVTLNADFGTTAGKVCEGNDARLSDARTPTSHTHGNITNGGEIGSTAGLVVKTGSAGIVTTLALGTAGQVLAVNSGATDIEWATPTGGGGGGTKTYAVFTPLDAQPPASNFATLDTRNSIAVLEFDGGATDESTTFVGVMPEAASLGSGLKVRIHWMADTATSDNVVWGVQFERMNTDLDSDSFDTASELQTATSGTSGIPVLTEITITTIDGITAGDPYRLKVYRKASDTTNDDMSGDAQLIAVEVRSAA